MKREEFKSSDEDHIRLMDHLENLARREPGTVGYLVQPKLNKLEQELTPENKFKALVELRERERSFEDENDI